MHPKSLYLDPAAIANLAADSALCVADENRIEKGHVHRDDSDVTRFFLDGTDLDAILLQTGWIAASFDGNGIRTRLPLSQVVKK